MLWKSFKRSSWRAEIWENCLIRLQTARIASLIIVTVDIVQLVKYKIAVAGWQAMLASQLKISPSNGGQ